MPSYDPGVSAVRHDPRNYVAGVQPVDLLLFAVVCIIPLSGSRVSGTYGVPGYDTSMTQLWFEVKRLVP